MNIKRYHHIFDISSCNDSINDRQFLRDTLQDIASTVDMQIIEGPIIAEGQEGNPGFSALCIIDFSHISIHTFSVYNEVLVDIFSCKEYDREKVRELVLRAFSTQDSEVRNKEVWWG
jgi:S-adenosylmethionine decarboxylase